MSDGYLKIKVNGGGCTGLTYGMSAEAEPSKMMKFSNTMV